MCTREHQHECAQKYLSHKSHTMVNGVSALAHDGLRSNDLDAVKRDGDAWNRRRLCLQVSRGFWHLSLRRRRPRLRGTVSPSQSTRWATCVADGVAPPGRNAPDVVVHRQRVDRGGRCCSIERVRADLTVIVATCRQGDLRMDATLGASTRPRRTLGRSLYSRLQSLCRVL